MSRKSAFRYALFTLLAWPALSGSTCPGNDCGQIVLGSNEQGGPGVYRVDVSGGPADGSLLLTVANQVYVGSPVQAGAEPTTYEFSNLPQGTYDVTWQISGCGDENVPIDGPASITVQ